MYMLSINKYRWRISKDGEIVLSGIGTAQQAIAVAKAYGIVLSKLIEVEYKSSVGVK